MEEAEPPLRVTGVRDRIRKAIENAFARYGVVVVRHSVRLLVVSAVLMAVCVVVLSVGSTSLETSPTAWIPHQTRGWRDFKTYSALFPDVGQRFGSGITQLITLARGVDDSVLSPAALAIADRVVRAITTDSGTLWEKACKRDIETNACIVVDLFRALGPNATAFDSGADAFVGGVTNTTAHGVRARAWNVLLYALNDGENDDIVIEWERWAFHRLVNEVIPSLEDDPNSPVDLVFYSEETIVEETARLVSSEYPLMAGTVVLIFVYMCVVLSGRPLMHSRILLGLSLVATVLFSLISSFAVVAITPNVAFTVLSPLVIFVGLGVGIDDIVIVVDALPPVARGGSLEARIATCLRTSGYAVTVTSLTSVVAFLLASTVDMAAISYFCILCALAIGAVWLLQWIFFMPLLVLDERRRSARRYDCLPCIQAAAAPPTTPQHGSRKAVGASKDDDDSDDDGSHWVRTLLLRGLLPIVRNRWGALCLIVAFMGCTGFLSYHVWTIERNVDVTTLFPSDSLVKRFHDASRQYFGDLSRPISFVSASPLDYQDESVRSDLHALYDELLESGFAREPASFWLRDFELYVNHTTQRLNSTNFYGLLLAFVDAAPFVEGGVRVVPAEFKDDLRWRDGKLIATRFSVTAPWSSNQDVAETVIKTARDYASAHPALQVFAFAPSFLYTDRDTAMPTIIVSSLLQAALGVVIVLLVLLPLKTVVILTVCVCCIDIDILGVLAVTGNPLSIATFATLSIAIGLSVDMAIHSVNHMDRLDRSLPFGERLEHTYASLGTSIFNGGLSTLLGVLLLAFSRSPGFRVFFLVLACTVVFGLAHGLVFAPAVLVLPDAWKQHRGKDDKRTSSQLTELSTVQP